MSSLTTLLALRPLLLRFPSLVQNNVFSCESGGMDDVYTYVCLPPTKKLVRGATCVTAENIRYMDTIYAYEAVPSLCIT